MSGRRIRPWFLWLGICVVGWMALWHPSPTLAQVPQPVRSLDLRLFPLQPWECATVTAGRDNSLTLMITNMGDETFADMELSVTGLPARWTASLQPDRVPPLEPGSSDTVELTIRPHSLARRESRRGITILGQSDDRPRTGSVCVDVRLSPLRLWGTVGLGVAVALLFAAIFVWYGRRAA